MRKASPQQLRFQIVAVVVGATLVIIGFVIAYLLSESMTFSRLLSWLAGSEVSENAQLAASLGVGLAITALLMLTTYLVVPRRRGSREQKLV